MPCSSRSMVLCLVTILLSACSTVQLAYNNADWFMMREVDKYFDITTAQKTFLEPRLDNLLCWHRQNALPEYAAFVEAFTKRTERELTRDDIDWLFLQVEQQRHVMLEQMLPGAAHFLAGLSQAQLKHYDEAVEESSEETRELIALPREKRLEERADRTLKSLREWFGRFDKTQTKEVRALSKAMPETRALWYQFQRERHAAMLKLLNGTSDAKVIETQLTDWWLSTESAYPTSIRDRNSAARQAMEAMVLAIDKLLTDKQKQLALKKLDSYREDFQALHEAADVCAALPGSADNNAIQTGS